MKALLLNVHPIPVFSPFDNIEPMNDHVLGDVNFVIWKASNFMKLYGYSGPGWQHRILTEWLLYTGVIQWSDISHKLTATAHLPADLLKKTLEKTETAWGDAGPRGATLDLENKASTLASARSCLTIAALTV